MTSETDFFFLLLEYSSYAASLFREKLVLCVHKFNFLHFCEDIAVICYIRGEKKFGYL